MDSPEGGLNGFPPLQVDFHASKAFFVPKICNHCAATPCTQVCPVGASYRTKDGVVLVDAKRCIGCAYCVQACPYGCRFLSPATHTAEKCTWCYHRITKGLKPACVTACPTVARRFGLLTDPEDPVTAYIRTNRVYTIRPETGNDPQVRYTQLARDVL